MKNSTYWFALAAAEEYNFVEICRYMVLGLECLLVESAFECGYALPEMRRPGD